MSLFRVPITSGFELFSYRRILALAPVLASLLIVFIGFILGKCKISLITLLGAFFLIIVTAHALTLYFFLDYNFMYELVPLSSLVFFSMLFATCCSMINFNQRFLNRILELLSFSLIWAGGLFFFIQLFTQMTPDQIAEIMIPKSEQIRNYPDAIIYSHRNIGFLFKLEPSGVSILAAVSFLFTRYITEYKELSTGNRLLFFLSLLVGSLSIFFSSSFTLSLGLYLIIGFIAFQKLTLKYFSYVSFVIFLVSLLIFLNKDFMTLLITRLQYYHNYLGGMIDTEYFVTNCNFSGFFYRLEPAHSTFNLCRLNEVLFFDKLAFMGLVPSFGWYFFIFIPFFIKLKRYKLQFFKNLDSHDFLLLAFFIPMIHMSGIEEWGNNFLFLFISIFIISKEGLFSDSYNA